MKVIHYHRRPAGSAFSVERYFATVRSAMPPGVDCEVAVSSFLSIGLLPRLYNIVEAAFRQGDVNHITGDVHFLTLFLRKRKTILNVLDCFGIGRYTGWKQYIYRMVWLQLPIWRARLVTTISEFTKGEILRHTSCPPGKIRVVYVPVDPRFRPEPSRFREENPTILQIGTRPNKNLERVAEALRGIACQLKIIGPLSDSQRETLMECGIRYSTHEGLSDEEIVEAYRRCDLVVFASTYEGFGMPIVEANAVGRPVITSNLASMPEVAADAACIVDPYDPGSIRSGILRVIQDSAYREGLIERGYRNAARFSPAAIAQQYASMYHEISSTRPVSRVAVPAASRRPLAG
jgi:glycosyltransferase involved in cell wall biosynthesis